MNNIVHPAIPRLFIAQTFAKARHLRNGFSTPRRFVLSALGLALGLVYASNIIISVYLREPMAPDRFKSYIPLGLLAYVLWDLIKNACRQPDEALIWTRVERERLHMAPFSRCDILSYRFSGILLAAIAKATIFSIVMFVDIPIFACGLFGALTALVFIDLLRMIVSMTTFAMSRKTFLAVRAVVLGITAYVSILAMSIAWRTMGADEEAATGSIKLAAALGRAFFELGQTSVGSFLAAPFTLFSAVMTADTFTLSLGGRMLASLLMVGATGWSVVHLDAAIYAAKQRSERAKFDLNRHSLRTARAIAADSVGGRIRHFGPLMTLVWRQAMGAKRYWGSVTIALVLPTIFSLMPVTLKQDSDGTFFAVVGSLAFYSFVLLPSALKFDFRCDFYRMSAIKALPLKPSTIVFGQLACPVIITSLFQLIVVVAAVPLTGSSIALIFGAMLILLPLNVFIFALDNFIFLLYPHPMKQEGIETFARTTLSFTGKGILFGLAVIVMISWAFCSAAIAETTAIHPKQTFVAGLALLLTTTGILSVMATVWAYQRFDTCADAVLE